MSASVASAEAYSNDGSAIDDGDAMGGMGQPASTCLIEHFDGTKEKLRCLCQRYFRTGRCPSREECPRHHIHEDACLRRVVDEATCIQFNIGPPKDHKTAPATAETGGRSASETATKRKPDLHAASFDAHIDTGRLNVFADLVVNPAEPAKPVMPAARVVRFRYATDTEDVGRYFVEVPLRYVIDCEGLCTEPANGETHAKALPHSVTLKQWGHNGDAADPHGYDSDTAEDVPHEEWVRRLLQHRGEVRLPPGYHVEPRPPGAGRDEVRHLWWGRAPDAGAVVLGAGCYEDTTVRQMGRVVKKPGGVSFDDFFQIGGYDVRIVPERLGDVYEREKGWRVVAAPGMWEQLCSDKYSTLLVSITGAFNAGKTWLFNRLSQLTLPSGSTTHTQGFCLALVPLSEHERLCLADQAGQNSPSTHLVSGDDDPYAAATARRVDPNDASTMSPSSEKKVARVERRMTQLQLRENFLSRCALAFGDVFIHVVGDVRHADRRHIMELVASAARENRRKDVFILHNLKTMRDKESLTRYVERTAELFQGHVFKHTVPGMPDGMLLMRVDSNLSPFARRPVSLQHFFLISDEKSSVVEDWRHQYVAAVLAYLRRRIEHISGREERPTEWLERIMTNHQDSFATATRWPKLKFIGGGDDDSAWRVQAVYDGAAAGRDQRQGDAREVAQLPPPVALNNPDFRWNILRAPAAVATPIGKKKDAALYTLQLVMPGLALGAAGVDRVKKQLCRFAAPKTDAPAAGGGGDGGGGGPAERTTSMTISRAKPGQSGAAAGSALLTLDIGATEEVAPGFNEAFAAALSKRFGGTPRACLDDEDRTLLGGGTRPLFHPTTKTREALVHADIVLPRGIHAEFTRAQHPVNPHVFVRDGVVSVTFTGDMNPRGGAR